MKSFNNTAKLLVATLFVFSFTFSTIIPATTYAQESSNSTHQDKKKDEKKKQEAKKKAEAKKKKSKNAKKTAKVTTKTVTENRTIPFTTSSQNDPNTPQGQNSVLQEGSNGTETIKYKVTYTNGKRTKKTLVSRQTIVAAVPRIVGVGTYVAPAPEPIAPVSDSSGATAQCADGSYSYAAHHQGACSHHGGVSTWYR